MRITKGLLGIAIVLFVFLLILITHGFLGSDKGQSTRSDWFPLIYILPFMAGMLFYFIASVKEKKQ